MVSPVQESISFLRDAPSPEPVSAPHAFFRVRLSVPVILTDPVHGPTVFTGCLFRYIRFYFILFQ